MCQLKNPLWEVKNVRQRGQTKKCELHVWLLKTTLWWKESTKDKIKWTLKNGALLVDTTTLMLKGILQENTQKNIFLKGEKGYLQENTHKNILFKGRKRLAVRKTTKKNMVAQLVTDKW